MASWPGGRAFDSEPSGPGFDPHRGCHVVSFTKIKQHVIKYYILTRVLVNMQKSVTPFDMNDKLLTER